MPIEGHYGSDDVRFIVEHDGTELLEVKNFSWDFDNGIEAAGSGLGFQKNSYYKQTDATKGTFKLDRSWFQRTDKGSLFLDLVRGSSVFITELIAASSTTYTASLSTALRSILSIRNNTNNVILREGLDYTVNYTTGVITFPAATPDAYTIRYLASNRYLYQYLANGGFEDAITNIWVLFGTATVARDTANAYTEGYALKVTPSAANDGVQYNLPLNLPPGRQYRLRGVAKAAAAETLIGYWYDGTSDQAMTVVSGGTLSTTYTPFEMTFTPTKSAISNLKIKDTKASPGIFYLDNLMLIDDTTGNNPTIGNNPMDSGLALSPFTFNVILRRVQDGATVGKLIKCAIDKLSFKAGKGYEESLSGMFLDYQGE